MYLIKVFKYLITIPDTYRACGVAWSILLALGARNPDSNSGRPTLLLFLLTALINVKCSLSLFSKNLLKINPCYFALLNNSSLTYKFKCVFFMYATKFKKHPMETTKCKKHFL